MRFLITLSLIFIATGCSPRKGYEGPELPPSQIVTIKRGDLSGMDNPAMNVNGLRSGWFGITVLPGEVAVEIVGGIASPGSPSDCSGSDSLNYRELERCQKKNSHCNECSYTSVDESCRYDFDELVCSTTFPGKAGVIYTLEFGKGAMKVLEKKSGNLIASTPCENGTHYSREEGKTVKYSLSAPGVVSLSDGSTYIVYCQP